LRLILSADSRGIHFEYGDRRLTVVVSLIFSALRTFFNIFIDVWNNILSILSGQSAMRV
jgi:hypothetical protein